MFDLYFLVEIVVWTVQTVENPARDTARGFANATPDFSCGKSVQSFAAGGAGFSRFPGKTEQNPEKRRIPSVFTFFPHPVPQAFLLRRCGKPHFSFANGLFQTVFHRKASAARKGSSSLFRRVCTGVFHAIFTKRKARGQPAEKMGKTHFSQISSRKVLMSNSNTGSRTILSCTHSCEDMMVE